MKKFSNIFSVQIVYTRSRVLNSYHRITKLGFQGKSIGKNSKNSMQTARIYHVYWILLVRSTNIEKIFTNYGRYLVSWGDILILKLFSLLVAFLNLHHTVLLTHLHNILGMKSCNGQFLFLSLKGLSAIILFAVLRDTQKQWRSALNNTNTPRVYAYNSRFHQMQL